MKPIYRPKGRAAEYGDYAVNIYTGCTHGCIYCYAPLVLRRDREEFHTHVVPRPGIVQAIMAQLRREQITGKLIHLCFTCDPYPAGVNTMVTREIIKAIKYSGNHVQILTKNPKEAERDFDLLDSEDIFGVTITGNNAWVEKYEPGANSLHERHDVLLRAHRRSIKTWASFEPVYDPELVKDIIICAEFIDLYKIGKLNYATSEIDWGAFGRECERLCVEYCRNYYIKDDLRRCMEVHNADE